jgi:mitochondrial fission protein ELM1
MPAPARVAPRSGDPMAARPTVWVLLGKGTGGNGQMISLAEALGWPFAAKQLVYNRLSHCPNVLLGAAAISIDRRRSAALEPPWPDLVIAGSRRSAPVARWIKRQSGGVTRLVHLMHTQAPLEHFDLIITTPQYRLPTRPNVLHNAAPLNHIDPRRVASAADQWAARLARLPRPYTALLVGGDSSAYVLDPATADRLGRETSAQVRATGGALLLTTSARTPAAATQALLAAIDCPAYTYQWRPGDAENPYHAFLALADRFIVTADSASLLAEACATGKAVQIFEWPVRAEARRGMKGLLRRWGEIRDRQVESVLTSTRSARLYDRLVYLGVIKPARDFAAYHRALKTRGLVASLGEPSDAPARRPLDDMERAVQRINLLFSDRGESADRADQQAVGVGPAGTHATDLSSHPAAKQRAAWNG